MDLRHPQRMAEPGDRACRPRPAAAHGAGRSDGALDALVSDGFASARGLRPGDEPTALVNGKRRVLRIVGMVLSPEYIFAGMAGMPICAALGCSGFT